MGLIWFRLHAEILDNPRVQKLPDDLFKLWINLQCVLAQEKTAAHGKLPSSAHLAFRLRMSVNETVDKLDKLTDFRLLKSKVVTKSDESGDDNVTVGDGKQTQNSLVVFHQEKEYFLINWDKKQYKSDTSKERMQRHRDRKRDVTVTPPDQNQIISESDQIKGVDLSRTGNQKGVINRVRNYGGSYDVLNHITEDEIEEAKSNAPEWDIVFLAGKFNGQIKSGVFMEPTVPQVAFKNWVKTFTKGRKP